MQRIYFEDFALHVSTTNGHHQVRQTMYTVIKRFTFTFAYIYCLSVYSLVSGLSISPPKKSYPCTGCRGPYGYKRLRQLAHRWRQGCQPYVPATFYPQEDSWYSFLLQAESTPGP
jgi:hypothetical protein